MNAVSRPVLRYHGGKFGNRGSVADKIIATFPPHRVYVESFGGAASILMRKPRSSAEVYNDLWGGAVTVFAVLRDPDTALELVRLTPFARDEFSKCTAEVLKSLKDKDPVEFARLTIFRSFAGFGSAASNPRHQTGFRANSLRSGTTPARDWANYADVISTFTDRLRGVTIENRDAIECALQHDSPETLHLFDPPYVHSTRKQGNRYCQKGYVHEMIDDDHRRMAEAVHDLKGMAIVCGYRSKLYGDLFRGWETIEFDALADGARPRREVLWFNPAATAARRQHSAPGPLFKGVVR
jgi:DNA adenine methylase